MIENETSNLQRETIHTVSTVRAYVESSDRYLPDTLIKLIGSSPTLWVHIFCELPTHEELLLRRFPEAKTAASANNHAHYRFPISPREKEITKRTISAVFSK